MERCTCWAMIMKSPLEIAVLEQLDIENPYSDVNFMA